MSTSTIQPDDVQREARHHFELYHALRNRIDEDEPWQVNGNSFDQVEPEEPTETGFADLVVYDGTDPWLVIECKKLVKGDAVEAFEPHSSTVIKQASRYADDIGAQFIATYNGQKLVLLRAHEAHRSLLQRRKITYEQSDFEDEEDMIFTVMEDMVEIYDGDEQRWDEEFDVLVDRLRELHRFIYPHLQTQLKELLNGDEDFASAFEEWANEQGFDYKKSWIGDDSLTRTYRKKRETVHNKFAREDAYLLINQLLFYKIVEDAGKLRTFSTQTAYNHAETENKILEIRSLTVAELDFLQDYLRTRFDTIVEDIDYEAVFEQDDIYGQVEFNERVADTLNDFIEEISEYDLSNVGSDFIGRLYEQLIPTQERKDLGEFYTPPKIAKLIIGGVMESPDDIVLDPAVGTGTFPVEAYQWINQHDGKTHQEIVDQIAGVDVNRFAAHLAVINLARQNLNQKTERTNIHINDFFRVSPEQHLLSSERATIDDSDGEEAFDVETGHTFADVNVVVGNPPYINRNEINDKDVKRAHLPSKYGRYGGDSYISKKSDIYQYFFTKGLEWLEDGGMLGYITSYKWTTIDSGIGLMIYLLNNTKIKGVIWFNKALFDDALVNTCITLLEKCGEDNNANKSERDDHDVPFLRVDRQMPTEEILSLLDSDVSHEGDGYRVILREQSELRDEEKWSRFLIAPTQYFEFRNHKKVTTVPKVCDTEEAPMTGIKTQCDDFFKVDEDTVTEWDIPEEYLTPGLMSKRDINDDAFLFRAEDTDEYFIDMHNLVTEIVDEIRSSPIVEDGEVTSPTNIEATIQQKVLERLRSDDDKQFAEYIEHMGSKHNYPREDKSDNIYNRGEVWFDLGELQYPELLIPETRQYRPGVMWNRDKLTVKDVGRPLYLEHGDEKLVGGLLNSSLGRIMIESHGRISGGQAIRMMVYDTETLPLVDPREVTEDQADRIRDAFDEWINDPTDDEKNEELDKAVLAVLNAENRWEEIQNVAIRMMEVRNETSEVKVLVGEQEQGMEISDVLSEEAEANARLSDYT